VDRQAPERQLNRGRSGGGVRFGIAEPGHEAALRRLLRETPMPGPVWLSLEAEPDYFAGCKILGGEHQTIVAVEGDDKVVCMGTISARERYLNGRVARVGYLSGLRLSEDCPARVWTIKQGYARFHAWHRENGAGVYFSSIVHGNHAGRRFLERGARGMPCYRALGEFVTLAVSRSRLERVGRSLAHAMRDLAARGYRAATARPDQSPEIARLLAQRQPGYHLAPIWNGEQPRAEDFRIILGPNNECVACTAVWDQRAVRQTVVRRYSWLVTTLRSVVGLGLGLAGWPLLPHVGQVLPQAYLAYTACADTAFAESGQEFAVWLTYLLSAAPLAQGVECVTLGFDARDPRLASMRRFFGGMAYLSTLYVVCWEDGMELAESLDDRLLAPEVALL
jgi:hypothetical protein